MKQLVFFGLMLLFFCRCDIPYEQIDGSGNVVTETKNIGGFTEVKLAGSMDAVVSKSDDYKVEIATDDNIMQYVKAVKRGDALVIEIEEGISIRNSKGIQVAIQMPELNEAELAGSGSLKTTSAFSSPEKFKGTIAGSGNLFISSIHSPEVVVTIAGSGNATISGETKTLDVTIAGSGDYHGDQLKSEEADISIGGSGNAHVFASTKLKASIAGSGDVIYSGSPEITEHAAGSGKVKKAN